jgi:hypothetical protein
LLALGLWWIRRGREEDWDDEAYDEYEGGEEDD